MTESYRGSFHDPSKAEDYEHSVFGPRSYGALLWSIESRWLVAFAQGLSRETRRLRYLDFACGTGRVLSALAPLVSSARGIDTSGPMLAIARQKVGPADLICADITDPSVQQEGVYDVITAFRFLLNAEPELRHDALQGLCARLADDSSRLVVSIQASAPSYRSLQRSALRPGAPENSAFRRPLSRREVRTLATAAGLEVVETYGYDLLSGRSLRLLPFSLVLRLEGRLAGTRLTNAFGGHRIYVMKRAG